MSSTPRQTPRKRQLTPFDTNRTPSKVARMKGTPRKATAQKKTEKLRNDQGEAGIHGMLA